MANQGNRASKGSRRSVTSRRPTASKQKPKQPTKKVVFDAARPEPEAPRTFRLGVVPGATPGKWIDAWKKRMPHVSIDLVPIEVSTQRAALDEVDAALVRLPLRDDDAFHVIALYDEVPVVVAAADSHLMAAEELTPADLVGETLIELSDDVFAPLDLPGTTPARFSALATGEAVVTAASGVGIVIVPMSLARLHNRKDADYRLLTDGPVSTVAFAWNREHTTPDVETFIGIVRGRTANSSR